MNHASVDLRVRPRQLILLTINGRQDLINIILRSSLFSYLNKLRLTLIDFPYFLQSRSFKV